MICVCVGVGVNGGIVLGSGNCCCCCGEGGEEEGLGSGLMTTTFWSVMISSAESRREKPSESSMVEAFSSSAKNSNVFVLKARANFWNISEI